MNIEKIDYHSQWVYDKYSKEIDKLKNKFAQSYLNFSDLKIEFTKFPYENNKNNFDLFVFYHTKMFINSSEINEDLHLFNEFLLSSANVLYGDHTIAYRLINLSKIYNLLDENQKSICYEILKLDSDLLLDRDFTILSRGYNHAVDQLFGLVCYHKYIDRFSNAKYDEILTNLKLEVFDSVDGNYVHLENTPDYHYYAMQRLTAINEVIDDIDIKNLLIQMTNYLSYVTPTLGAQIINIGDAAGKKVWSGSVKNAVLQDSDRSDIKWISTGYLIYKTADLYFYIKSSKKHWNHHHYDNLSFIINYKGQDFIVDAGTYSYENNHPNKIYCQSPYAHNTMCLPDSKLLVSNNKNQYYFTNAVKISKNKFLFSCSIYDKTIYKRIVTLNDKFICMDDYFFDVPPNYNNIYSIIHFGINIHLSMTDKLCYEAVCGNSKLLIKINNTPPFESLIINDGYYKDNMVGFNSKKFYEFESTPTLLFDIINEKKEYIHHSYSIYF